MKKIAIALSMMFVLTVAAGAQKKMKPWTEWSEKEAAKMLNDSAWGQTQNETNTSEMFYSPTSDRVRNASRDSQGAYNQATNIGYGIRFLSAKPIRQAIARQLILKNPQMTEALTAFANQKSDQFIVVAVDYNSADRRLSGPAMQIFSSANVGTLKNTTYLERKDGKRVFLDKYLAPTDDGMGAKFVFPRQFEGKPFIDKDSGFIRFYAEFPGTTVLKLNMRYKVPDMIYEDNLEY
ncbi:MAG TPA: hypothetical protein PLD20_00610 [Blastocatellia bacterium]|nr:hypothetical protein [Blastocatellia bacterium]HMV85690.1 hypothetical protein [Blastocatellia bacterium]HMX24190.1 hypothetical protein [Blastocatellia bacterium]HMY72250.1 hypothetical protein [Blastocatellia bacterium]HMZ16435.1 hypothetical protein [Blastocatellia bacterium]